MGVISVYWLELLENTSLATAVRESSWLYPWIEIFHIIGIVLLVGPALMFDFRLLGFSKHLPVKGLASHLLAWSRKGLLLAIPTGLLLFISNAKTLGNDPVFWAKMLWLILAGFNAIAFHKYTARSITSWNEYANTSFGAKVSAIVSIILWLAVIACGRLLAY